MVKKTETLTITEAPQPRAAKKLPKKTAKKKVKAKKQAQSKPLPPPVEPSQAQPFLIHGQGASVPVSSEPLPTFLNSTEPKPGEPLSQDAEQLLQDVPESVGGPVGEVQSPANQSDAESIAAASMMSEIASAITFEEDDVRAVLEEGFSWLAERFESEHWKLTERQSKVIGRPAAQLLTSLWGRVCEFLPDWMMRAADSTPGLAGFVLATGIVVGPKVMTQIKVSRTRKEKPLAQVPRRSAPAPSVSNAGPVGPIPMTEAWPAQDFEAMQ